MLKQHINLFVYASLNNVLEKIIYRNFLDFTNNTDYYNLFIINDIIYYSRIEVDFINVMRSYKMRCVFGYYVYKW